MKNTSVPVARQRDMVIQNLDDEVLIYDLKRNKALCLNQSSFAVWQLCDGTRDAAAIAKKMGLETKQTIPVEFVDLALHELEKQELLEGADIMSGNVDTTSRREMIRKAGLATAMALPMITAIIAPSSADAQSAASLCAPGLTFCPQSNPFGYPMPAGCYDLLNGAPGIFPAPIVSCTHCGWACTSGMCVGGICQPL